MAIIKVITPSVTDANITTAKVTDNAITLAKMASGTDGNIISYDASGNPVAIATGSDGQVLTSTGAGSPPAFENSAVGGKLLQHQFDSDSSLISFSNTSFVDTNLSINFTPQSSSSSILIFGCVQLYHDGGQSSHGSTEFKILNGSSTVGESITTLIGYGGNEAFWSGMLPYYLKESSSNTNQRTYKVQVKNSSSGASASYNQYGGLSTLNIMEIA